MRYIKTILLALFVVVGILFGITTLRDAASGKLVGPEIRCDSDLLEVSVTDGNEALLAGVTASDAQDGDLTDAIRIQGVSKLITDDTAKVSYIVFDSHGNAATVSRKLRYTDYSRPRFRVETPLVFSENETITILSRIHAEDVLDGDLTDSIRISALSATSDPDIQSVAVQVTNSMGDTTRLDLPVIIHSGLVVRPEVKLSDYLIYLKEGDSFKGERYLLRVDTPEGIGDIDEVHITGKVDTSTPGTYYVYYRYPYGISTGVAVLTVVVG